ncbi:transposase [Pseudomonas sp. IT-347P]
MWQVVASAQQTVAPSTTERVFDHANPWVSRKKRRDVASFGGVLEALSGRTFRIRPFIVRYAIFQCVSGALIHLESESQGNVLANSH